MLQSLEELLIVLTVPSFGSRRHTPTKFYVCDGVCEPCHFCFLITSCMYRLYLCSTLQEREAGCHSLEEISRTFVGLFCNEHVSRDSNVRWRLFCGNDNGNQANWFISTLPPQTTLQVHAYPYVSHKKGNGTSSHRITGT